MTKREKYLSLAGLFVGLLTAVIFFVLSRFVLPESHAARMEDADSPATESGAGSTAGAHEHGGTAAPSTASASEEPPQTIQLTDDEQHSIGLQTAVIQRRVVRGDLLTTARVEQPETQLATISARVGGRIDKLHVDFTGQPVRRGQPIAEIYSPEILASAEEYKLALESRARLGGSADAQAVSGAADLVAASRRRLELWGLTAGQIDGIATSDKPQIELTIFSNASGIVSERKVTQGQYVNAGDALYIVTDLSSVWVQADIYEADLPQVRVGQEVQITADSVPGAKLHGKVSFLDPTVNGQTRTASARIQVPNPGMRLRPGMFVQARFAPTSGERTLAVPRSAVVNTGTHKFVYVVIGNGNFAAHEVQLGPASDSYYAVLAGLRDGDRVVTEGNFLLDSQTRLSGGMSGMFGGSKEFSGQQAAPDSTQWKVSFKSDPATPSGGSETVAHVSLQDAAGKPVSDAQVQVTLFMPAMPAMDMAEMRETATLKWTGSDYAGTIRVPTRGTWTVTVDASRGQSLTSYRSSLNAK